MANESTLTDTVVIAAAKAYLITQLTTLAKSRDYSKQGGRWKTVSKIRFGLKALNQPIIRTPLAVRLQILYGLCRICGIYNSQNVFITT